MSSVTAPYWWFCSFSLLMCCVCFGWCNKACSQWSRCYCVILSVSVMLVNLGWCSCWDPSAGSRSKAPLLVRSGVSGLQVTYAREEKMLFQELIAIMRRCVFSHWLGTLCVQFYQSEPLRWRRVVDPAFSLHAVPPGLTQTSCWDTRCRCIHGATFFNAPLQ